MSVIHYFNPGHESAVLNRLPSYTPPSSMTTIMKELSSLPVWYASAEDVVLVDDGYNKDYHLHLADLGINLPAIRYSRELRQFDHSPVSMWGITPAGIRVFEAINRNYELNLNIPRWNDEFVHLNSRMAGRDVLKELIDASPHFKNIDLPQFYSNLEDVKAEVRRSTQKLLAKSPYSSSGRGLVWLPTGELTRSERQILQGMLNKQGSLSLEPVYDKQVDFAMEFMSDNMGMVRFVGYSLFTTNEKGAYEGNILCRQAEIVAHLTQYISVAVLEDAKKHLEQILETNVGSIYKGCIGVDMMICKLEGDYILHPCVEVNMRYNMGYLSVRLFDNYISPNSEGRYILDFDAEENIYQQHQQMQAQYPLVVKNGRVTSGYLSLCAISSTTKYRAYILIEASLYNSPLNFTRL